VPYTLTLINNLPFDETFDLTYTSAWSISGPPTVGPVPAGTMQDFAVSVTVPEGLDCYERDIASAFGQAQSAPVYSDTAYLNTSVAPADIVDVVGTISEANTGLGIPDAYAYLELGDLYYETHSGPDGAYVLANIPACTYDGLFEAFGYYGERPVVTVVPGGPNTVDVSLTASWPELSPDEVSVDMLADHTARRYLRLANEGTGDLNWYVTEVPNGTPFPPPLARPPMPSGVDAQVYADLKAAPDGMAKFVVYMKEQADLSAAFNIKDRSARGRYVLDRLRATAERSQANLRTELEAAGVRYESRYIVNALVVEGNAALVDSLATRTEVAAIGPNAAIPAPAPVASSPAPDGPDALEWNITRVRADAVWSDFGVTGQGMIISNVDTGVQFDHPALVAQYRGNLGGGSYDHNYNWWDPYNQNPLVPTDAAGHGTHTMGTMVGSDDPDNPGSAPNGIGIAPGATWMACDGFDNNTGVGYNAELLECAEFILAPWDLTGANADPDMRPDTVNNSWGGGQAQWWYEMAIYAWRAAGIFPSFSNGNAGPSCGTAGDPGDSANVMSAGATDINDTIAGFSSRGPAAISGLTKPDVAAPGSSVRSSVPGGYSLYSGTSMAAPHVAGEAALIWSAVPELRGDVQTTYFLIEHSAVPIFDDQCGDGDAPNNVYGWGRIDAHAAVSLALSVDWDIPWLSVDPFMGVVPPESSQNVQLTFDSTGLTAGECYTSTLAFDFNDPYVQVEFVPVEMCVVERLHVYLPLVLKNH
jgi:subtilisin family serine protease